MDIGQYLEREVGMDPDAVSQFDAAAEGFYNGQKQFVEAKIEHVNTPYSPRRVPSGIARYAVDDKRDRVVVSSPAFNSQENDGGIVTEGHEFAEIPSTLWDYSLNQLPAETDYRHLQSVQVPLREDYEFPVADITYGGGTDILVDAEGEQLLVSDGEEDTLPLSHRTVRIDGDDDESDRYCISPVISVRNNGVLDVFSTSNPGEDLLPLNTDDEYIEETAQELLRSDASTRIDPERWLLHVNATEAETPGTLSNI